MEHKVMIACRPDPTRRTSADSVWPLRGAEGLTWAERKERNRGEGAVSIDREIVTITVCLSHDYNRELNFELEDAVKESRNRMLPWFTRRHGITNGVIDLEGGAVRITWQYDRETEGHTHD